MMKNSDILYIYFMLEKRGVTPIYKNMLKVLSLTQIISTNYEFNESVLLSVTPKENPRSLQEEKDFSCFNNKIKFSSYDN